MAMEESTDQSSESSGSSTPKGASSAELASSECVEDTTEGASDGKKSSIDTSASSSTSSTASGTTSTTTTSTSSNSNVGMPRRRRSRHEEAACDVSPMTSECSVSYQSSEEEIRDLETLLKLHREWLLEMAANPPTQGGRYKKKLPQSLSESDCQQVDREDLEATNPFPPTVEDIDELISRMKQNDPSLKFINLNNRRWLRGEQLATLAQALQANVTLEVLELANVGARDGTARELATALRTNTTLRRLNLESNFMSGSGLVQLLAAMNVNQTVTHFHVSNQRACCMGDQVENRMADLVGGNDTLITFGIRLHSVAARDKIDRKLEKNFDRFRQLRMNSASDNLD